MATTRFVLLDEAGGPVVGRKFEAVFRDQNLCGFEQHHIITVAIGEVSIDHNQSAFVKIFFSGPDP